MLMEYDLQYLGTAKGGRKKIAVIIGKKFKDAPTILLLFLTE